jgi:ABC-type transport system involved in Fe-S cluster assembly fused permease/ATPase subunit
VESTFNEKMAEYPNISAVLKPVKNKIVTFLTDYIAEKATAGFSEKINLGTEAFSQFLSKGIVDTFKGGFLSDLINWQIKSFFSAIVTKIVLITFLLFLPVIMEIVYSVFRRRKKTLKEQNTIPV